MPISGKKMVVLGGSGFIGQHVIEEAVRHGWQVTALARSDTAAATVVRAGATVLSGDANDGQSWFGELTGADMVVDLFQPARPKRLGRRQMRAISAQRQSFTRALVRFLRTLDPERRPTLISVSGIDDLAPDADGFLSSHSAQRKTELGFNSIGIPVRQIIERSGIRAAFVYLGSVYGPGGPFAEVIFPAIAAGKWKNFGKPSERMILIHVDDAARGIERIARLDAAAITGKSFVLTDTDPVGMTSFSGLAAKELGVPAPGNAPKWIAALIAGKPIVETTLHEVQIRPSFAELEDFKLKYSSYRSGLPATLQALG
jgi:NAD dependent epimerase/dehydratase family enzyme